MTSRQLQKLMLTLAAGVLMLGLAACNATNTGKPCPSCEQEQDSGTVDNPEPTGNPADPNDYVTEVALFDDPIAGLAYKCNEGSYEYNSYTKVNPTSTGPNADLPVARCDNNATSITYYLGDPDTNAIELGTIYLPKRGSLTPVASTTKGQTTLNSYLLTYSVKDMQNSPARLDLTNAMAANGGCNDIVSGKASGACQLIYKVALMQGLSNSKNGVMTIPLGVNNTIAKVESINTLAQTAFAELTYSAFQNKWLQGMTATSSVQYPGLDTGHVAFPALADLLADIKASSIRLRMGVYTPDYGSAIHAFLPAYRPGNLPEPTTLPELKDLLEGIMSQLEVSKFTGKFVVYPDGQMTGFGVLATGFCTSVLSPSPAPSCKSTFYTVSGHQGSPAQLTPTLVLDHVWLEGVGANNDTHIQLHGTFFGTQLYDGRQPVDPTQDPAEGHYDFAKSFPNSTLEELQKGSFTGKLLGETLPDYQIKNGKKTVGVSANGRPQPLPLQMREVMGLTQQQPLNSAVLKQLPGYYQLTFMRACVETNAVGCTPVPSIESTQKHTNYSAVCEGLVRQQDGSIVCSNSHIPQTEKPRPNIWQGSDHTGKVNLQLVKLNKGGQPATGSQPVVNVVAKLLNHNCQPVLDSNGNPVKVGFVTYTLDGNGSTISDSANLSLLFTPTDKVGQSTMPQLGVAVNGRIDLADADNPMYRLGDIGFKNEVRAAWSDFMFYRAKQYLDAGTAPDETTKGNEIHAMNSGAVSGKGFSSCQVIP